jgi:uncharacterized membrane protein YqgA involved in biofilm formation
MPVLVPGLTGTIINTIAVVIGSLIGIFIGHRLNDNTQKTVLHGLGLVTIIVAISNAITTQNILIPLFAIVIGAMIGEWMQLEERLDALGKWMERAFGERLGEKDEGRLVQAFVTASLVYCVGPLTIIGSINDGLVNNYEILLLKSTLDLFASIAFAASLGPGVILSAITVFLFQGGLALLALLFGGALGGVTMDNPAVIEMTATGGIVLLSIGFILLDIKRLRAANFLPAIFLAPAFVVLLQWLGIAF